MAVGKRQAERQDDLWLVAAELPQGPGHPFYRRLNQLLAAHGFDAFVEVYVVSVNGTIKPSAQVRVFRSGRAPSVRAFRGTDAAGVPAASGGGGLRAPPVAPAPAPRRPAPDHPWRQPFKKKRTFLLCPKPDISTLR